MSDPKEFSERIIDAVFMEPAPGEAICHCAPCRDLRIERVAAIVLQIRREAAVEPPPSPPPPKPQSPPVKVTNSGKKAIHIVAGKGVTHSLHPGSVQDVSFDGSADIRVT